MLCKNGCDRSLMDNPSTVLSAPVPAYLPLYARFLGRMRVFSADMYPDQLDGGTHVGSSELHRKTQQDTFDHVLIVLINL